MKHALFVVVWVLSMAGVALGAGPKVALVGDAKVAEVQNTLALAGVGLSGDPHVTLLERQAVDHLLAEHQLKLGGMLDAQQAIAVGRVLTVDLLAVLENQSPEGGNVRGLVIFDARTGVRLCDEAIVGKDQQAADAVAGYVRGAAAKYQRQGKGLRTVSMAGARNVDLPHNQDTWCEAMGRLVERALVHSPDLAVVERAHLEQVTKERVASADAPVNALLTSVQQLTLDFSRDQNRVKVSVLLEERDGSPRHAVVTIDREGCVQDVTAVVLKELGAAAPAKPFDRDQETYRALVEADFDIRNRNFAGAQAWMEAAVALGSQDRTNQMIIAGFYQCLAIVTLQPDVPVSLGVYKPHYDQAGLEQAIDMTIRAVDFELRLRRAQAASPQGVDVSRREDDPDINLLFLLVHFRAPIVPPGPRARDKLVLLDRMARELYLDLLIGGYCGPKAPMTNGYLVNNLGFGISRLAQDDIRLVFPDWSRVHAKLITTIAHRLETLHYPNLKRGAMPPYPQVNISYAWWFDNLMPEDIYEGTLSSVRAQPEDLKCLREAYRELKKQPRPALQILGIGGELACDARLGAGEEEVKRRAEALYDFITAHIIAPGVTPEDPERFACYEAAIVMIGAVKPFYDPAFSQRLFEFMLQRREIVCRLAAVLTDVTEMRLGWWNARYRPSTKAEVDDRLTKLAALVDSGNYHLVDANKEVLNIILEPIRGRGTAVAALWTGQHELIDVDNLSGVQYLSRPVWAGGRLMVVGVGELDGSGTTCSMRLFEMQLNGAPPHLVSTLKMPVPDPSRPHQYLGHGWSLTAPIVIGKMLYCSPGVLWGGLAEFPLDGSAPQLRTPKTDLKMPVAEIDVLGAAEGKLFAFNSSWEESGIFMFDPANEQWTTLASCRRSEKTSYLDYIFQYVDATVYDAPRHRLLLTMRQDGLPRDHPLKAGLYAVDLRNYAISKLVAFLYNAPVAMDPVTPSRIWLVFPLFDEVSRIYEFNPDSNLWHQVLNRRNFNNCDIDAKAMDDPKMGPSRSNTNIQLPNGLDPTKVLIPGKHNIFPPYVILDGWLWTFDPFGRVSLDGKQRQEFPEVEPRAKTNYFRTYHNSNTLSYLPDRRQVLYGDSHSLWLLDIPKVVQEADSARDTKTGIVNLFKLVDVTNNAFTGKWERRDGTLVSDGASGTTIEFLYQPPAEYDYRVVFARVGGNDSVAIPCLAMGRQFTLQIGGGNNIYTGFTLVGGKEIHENPTTRKSTAWLVNGQKYTAIVKVRKNGVQAYIDGQLITEWKTDYSDMSNSPHWTLTRNDTIGLGTWGSPSVFYSAEIIEITGKGQLLED